MRIYTRRGDDGTTGLLYGGRVPKDSAAIECNGAVDEAQAALGVARAAAERGSDLDEALISLERDLWVLMSEVATAPENRQKLKPGQTLVTHDMVEALERRIDDLDEKVEMPSEFVVPGQDECSALLDLARTVVRRAERLALPAVADGSEVGAYLNRLSDLLWTMARWQEQDHLLTRPGGRREGRSR